MNYVQCTVTITYLLTVVTQHESDAQMELQVQADLTISLLVSWSPGL